MIDESINSTALLVTPVALAKAEGVKLTGITGSSVLKGVGNWVLDVLADPVGC